MFDFINTLILIVGVLAACSMVLGGAVLAVLIIFQPDLASRMQDRLWALVPLALCAGLAICGLALTKWAITVIG